MEQLAYDASQFSLTPAAAQANAINRRLSASTSPSAGPNPIGPNPTPMMAAPAGPNPNPLTAPNVGVSPHTFPQAQATIPVAPNPLIGGTGNAELDKYLGTDATYQSQLSDLMRNYDQALAQKNLSQQQTNADYSAKERALNLQADQDRLDMRNSAAARGILQSGIYANQLGQYNTNNQQSMTNLLGGLQNAQDTSNLQFQQLIANEIAAKQKAIQDAAARRATQLAVI